MIDLRDKARYVLRSQNEGWPEDARGDARRKLNSAYDAFKSAYGPINKTTFSETEAGAEAALKALRKGAAWSPGEKLPDENQLSDWLKTQPAESSVIASKAAPQPAKKALPSVRYTWC